MYVLHKKSCWTWTEAQQSKISERRKKAYNPNMTQPTIYEMDNRKEMGQ